MPEVPYENINIYGLPADRTACGKLRLIFPLESLQRKGANTISRITFDEREASNYPILLLQRQITEEALVNIKKAKANGQVVLYELDDDIWNVPASSPAYEVYYPKSPMLRWAERCIAECHGVTCTTVPLARKLQQYNPNVEIYDNALDLSLGIRDWKTREEKTTDKVVVGWTGGCFDDQTEVLTNSGFKLFKDLDRTELLATLNEKNELEYHKPTNYIDKPWNADMISVERDHINFKVTPDHYLYASKRTKGDLKDNLKFERIQALDLFGKSFYCKRSAEWTAPDKEYFSIPNSVSFKMKDWLEFFGFWLAEGWTSNSKRIENGKEYDLHHIGICQHKSKEELFYFKNMLETYGYSCHLRKNDTELIIINSALWNYLNKFGDCSEKYIPNDILDCSSDQLKILLKWYLLGDGNKEISKGSIKPRLRAYTTSVKLADNLTEVALKIGWTASVKNRGKRDSYIRGKKIIARHDALYISFLQNGNNGNFLRPKINPEAQKIEHYEGRVYCVTVPNHTVYVRRNGICHWSGNSTHQTDIPIVAAIAIALLEHRDDVLFAIGGPDMYYKYLLQQGVPEDRLLNLGSKEFDSYPPMHSHIDIGVCPLMDIPFNRAKSWLKVLEYGAWKIPSICSPVYPYSDFNNKYPNLISLALTKEDWLKELDMLIDDERLRKQKASQIHALVWQDFDISKRDSIFVSAIDRLIGRALNKVEDKTYSPGRNDPCYCGSGKKYKKCCYNKQ